MTTEKAIEVLQSHKSHWKRLLREKICDKTEGIDFINAVDMAISALTEKAEIENEEIIIPDNAPIVKGLEWKKESEEEDDA